MVGVGTKIGVGLASAIGVPTGVGTAPITPTVLKVTGGMVAN